MASDPTRGSRHDFPSDRPGRTLLFSIKYTAPCFLLELEQRVYIFSVLVVFFLAFMLHRFTISLVSLISYL